MACAWFRPRLRLERASISTCLCILRAPAECCWSWCRGDVFSRRIFTDNRKIMLLLVTDTSGKNGFVALVRAADVRAAEDAQAKTRAVEAIEEVPLAGGTFSAQLVPQIAGLLTKHGISKTEMDAFIVVSGPGSFTGL